jgi:hypothetical protein
VGFEVFVSWYENGEPAPIQFAAVHAAFGLAAAPPEPKGFHVRYGPANESYVYATPRADGTLTDIMIERPCSAPALWDAIVAVMRLGNAFCCWPGDVCAVASAGVVDQLPDDVAEGLGEPQLVADGAALAQLVRSS